jgi:hypothetical protein
MVIHVESANAGIQTAYHPLVGRRGRKHGKKLEASCVGSLFTE